MAHAAPQRVLADKESGASRASGGVVVTPRAARRGHGPPGARALRAAPRAALEQRQAALCSDRPTRAGRPDSRFVCRSFHPPAPPPPGWPAGRHSCCGSGLERDGLQERPDQAWPAWPDRVQPIPSLPLSVTSRRATARGVVQPSGP